MSKTKVSITKQKCLKCEKIFLKTIREDENSIICPHCGFEIKFTRPEKVVTYHRESPKIGRNDLCPCGSGKKYKKCCGV